MRPEDIHNKRVLISPLNWGFGHVSRCIGLIDQLLKQENSIWIACDENQEHIFAQYFDSVEFIRHEGYPFHFRGKGNFSFDLARDYPRLKSRLSKELAETRNYVKEYNIDLVISDHRYGFRSKRVPCIFLTHQVYLPIRWFEWSAILAHRRHIAHFSWIWVLDYPDNRLAGKLSAKGSQENIEYIGPYSRFSRYEIPRAKSRGVVAIASGPDVYAQQFVDEMLKKDAADAIICSEHVRCPEEKQINASNWLEQDQIILQADKIISRSGYSTIMDLEILGVPGDLFPTPGQREQVYLYHFHQSKTGKRD